MVVFLLGEAELVIFLDVLPLVKLCLCDISQQPSMFHRIYAV
jgi:hypothetical protein